MISDEGERRTTRKQHRPVSKKIPESRLPLPTSSVGKTSRYTRHFDKGLFKWPLTKEQATPFNKTVISDTTKTSSSDNSSRRQPLSSAQQKTFENRKKIRVQPKKFSLCMNEFDSSDEIESVELRNSTTISSRERLATQHSPSAIHRQTGATGSPRKSSLPVRCTFTKQQQQQPSVVRQSKISQSQDISQHRRKNNFEHIFPFEEEEIVHETFNQLSRAVNDRLESRISAPGKRVRRRKKKSDGQQNVTKVYNSETSSMSGGSKRSSVISESNDSCLETSSLGILSPTEMQSNGSLSTSVASCGFSTSWMKRSSIDASGSASVTVDADLSVEDLENEETVAEETSSLSTTSNTLSSTVSSSTASSSTSARKKSSIACLVPRRPSTNRSPRISVDEDCSPKKFHRFHLDTETVREIESMDKSDRLPNLDAISKLPSYELPTTVVRPPSSRLPVFQPIRTKVEAFPDVSDLLVARTEELLYSARTTKKRRHHKSLTTTTTTTFASNASAEANIDSGRFSVDAESSCSLSLLTHDDASSHASLTHPPITTLETVATTAAVTQTETQSTHKNCLYNEVDAGIGSSMPSSLISNNSMLTSLDMCGGGISQYEMESSGVFSDADAAAGRKSAAAASNVDVLKQVVDVAEIKTKLPELEEEDVVDGPHPGVLGEDVGFNQTFDIDSQDVDRTFDVDKTLNVDSNGSNITFDVDNSLGEENVDETAENPHQSTQEVRVSSRQDRQKNRLVAKSAPVEVKRPRSQETKGLATKRSELLQENPILPNTNVGSKLKEILARPQPGSLERQEAKKPRPPGKWDAIMSSIAGGQKRTETEMAERLRDAKSKVFADFKPPIVLRKPSRTATPEVTSSSAAATISRSNSTVSSCSVSLASQHYQRRSVSGGASAALASRSNSVLSARQASVDTTKASRPFSRSNSQISSGSSASKTAKPVGSRSNSISSNVSSERGSEITLKGPKSSKTRPEVSVRQKSTLNTGPKSNTTTKDGNRIITSAPSASNPKSTTTTTTATRKASAPPATTSTATASASGTAPRKISASSKVATTTVKPGVNSSKANTTTAAAKIYHQPDLVKVSSPAGSQQQQQYEAQLQRENSQLRQRLHHNASGFTAIAIALGHVTEQLNSSDTPKLLNEIHQLKQQIRDQNNHIATLHETYNLELSKYKDCFSEADVKVKLSEVQDTHRSFVEKLLQDHQAEVEMLRESHRIDIAQLGDEQEELIRQLEARHRAQLDEMELCWKSKMAQNSEYKSDEIIKQESDFERREEQWAEVRRSLEEQIHVLKAELKEREEEAMMKHKGDTVLRTTNNKLTQIMAEVDSLKAVLEMKSEELRGLRADKIRLEEKLTDFDAMKTALQKASLLAEDLKAQIEAKNNLERKLSFENRRLHQTMERELHEKKKLSQENEELQWKIRQSLSGMETLSASMIDYTSASPNPMMFTSLQQNCLSVTLNSGNDFLGCPQSLPHLPDKYSSRQNNHRPVSAPPGKFDFLNRLSNSSTSTPKHQPHPGQDSPRVLEVVEKTESVAWKLDYNEAELLLAADLAGASPTLKRKLSPHSPMSVRKSTRNAARTLSMPADAMSRSMTETHRGSPSHDAMTRSCVSLSRSNSRTRKVTPSFETLSESVHETSMTETKGNDAKEIDDVKVDGSGDQHFRRGCHKARTISGSERSSNLSSISDEEDIGDISSSSEIEINEPVMEVTTPQIEEMQFLFQTGCADNIRSRTSVASSPDAEVTLRDDLLVTSASSATTGTRKTKLKSHGVMSRSMQCTSSTGSAQIMSNSLPSYDLQSLFKGQDALQNSGGESLMGRFDEEDAMTDSTSTESDDREDSPPRQLRPSQQQRQQQDLCQKRLPPSLTETLKANSVAGWSQDVDQLLP